MKIAFLVTHFPSLSETFILNQVTGLLDRGHDVHIYAQRPAESGVLHPEVTRYGLLERTRYAPARPGNVLRRAARALALLWMHGRRRPGPVARALNVFRFGRDASSLKLLFMAAPFLREPEGYDIIQCHFGPNGNLAVLLREIGATRGKIVTTFHGADIRLGLRKGGRIYAPLRRGGDCVLSISQYNRRNLEKFGFAPHRIRHHPVGIALDKFSADGVARTGTPGPHEPIRILTVARLVEEKGLEFGLRAIGQLLAARPSLRVEHRIVGGGPLEKSLRELAKELGLGEVVQFLGPQNQDEVSRHFREAHLFLLPSVAEALPVVLMEAQAAGLPVVCTNVGSVAELVADGVSGFIVPPGDAEALAIALGRLVEQPERWPEMGRAGRAHVAQHYDINTLNDRLVELYRELLA